MVNILWVDDEIDLLKPYILFLEAKGYSIISAIDGNEAMEALGAKSVDIIFLDENMPGLKEQISCTSCDYDYKKRRRTYYGAGNR